MSLFLVNGDLCLATVRLSACPHIVVLVDGVTLGLSLKTTPAWLQCADLALDVAYVLTVKWVRPRVDLTVPNHKATMTLECCPLAVQLQGNTHAPVSGR